jgi:hypothetical protein
MRTLLLLGGVIGLGIEVAVIFTAYAVRDGGHIAEEPFATFLFFVPLLLLSIRVLLRTPQFKKAALFGACVAMAGILLVALLDTTNLLVQYDRWAQRGLPERGTVSWWK